MVKRLKNDGTIETVRVPQRATPTNAVYVDLDEGDVVLGTSAVGTVGLAQRLGAVAQSWPIGAGALPQIGPFAGDQRVLITCSAGSVDVTTGSAVLGAAQLASDDFGTSSIVLPSGPIPAPWKKSSRTQMAIGDSITAQGSHMPHTPVGRGTRDLFPALGNINVGGLFVITLEAGPTTVAGNGTLKFYVSDSTMTWQAFGDAEGPRVLIDLTRCFYALESGAAGNTLYIGTVPARKPVADKTDVVNVTGAFRLRNNCGTYGHLAWTNALMSMPYDTSYSYSIPTIRAVDWWAARGQWENVYTDETLVMLGTNDSANLASAILAAAAVENIVKRRQGIGSVVTLVGLLPYTGAAAGVNNAMMHLTGMLRDIARRNNCAFVDPYPYAVDPNGSGAYAANMAGDGLHPSSLLGYLWASRGNVPAIASRVRTVDQRSFAGIAYNATTAPYGNLLLNGQLLGVAGSPGTGVSGEIPTSHTVVREAGSIITAVCTAPQSASPIARGDGKTGKYFRIAINNSTGTAGEGIRMRAAAFVTANIAVGEYFVFEGDLRIAGTGIQSIEAFANLDGLTGVALGGPGLSAGYGAYDLGGDTVSLSFRSAPCRLESLVSGILYGIVVTMQAGGTCTLDVGQTLNLHKVPAP